jgi:hypothetical protein
MRGRSLRHECHTDLLRQVLIDAERLRRTVSQHFDRGDARGGKLDGVGGCVRDGIQKAGSVFMDSNLNLMRGMFLLSDSKTMVLEQM